MLYVEDDEEDLEEGAGEYDEGDEEVQQRGAGMSRDVGGPMEHDEGEAGYSSESSSDDSELSSSESSSSEDEDDDEDGSTPLSPQRCGQQWY